MAGGLSQVFASQERQGPPLRRTASTSLPLGIILASASMTVMAGAIIAPVLNQIRDGLGMASSSVGLIITTHGLFMALSSPVAGIAIDRIGIRRPYIVGLIGSGLFGGAGMLTRSPWFLLTSRACFGVALALVYASITVWILNAYEGADRDRAMGWRASAQSLGGALWPFIGGALGAISWRLPFAVYLLGIPVGLLAFFALPEPAPRVRRGGRPTEPAASVIATLGDNPVLFLIYGLMFSVNLLLYVVVIFVPQKLEAVGVSSTLQIGLFLTLQACAAGATAFCYGAVRSRLSYPIVAMIAAALWGAAFASLSLSANALATACSVTLFGIAHGLMMPSAMVWLGSVTPPSLRGRLSSYLGTLGFIGQFLSPILFAPVLVLLGLRGVFGVAAGVGAAWFLLLLYGARRSRRAT